MRHVINMQSLNIACFFHSANSFSLLSFQQDTGTGEGLEYYGYSEYHKRQACIINIHVMPGNG